MGCDRSTITTKRTRCTTGREGAGTAHLRRVIIESAWSYQYRPWIGGALVKRQQGLDQEVRDIAWKAQWRSPHIT